VRRDQTSLVETVSVRINIPRVTPDTAHHKKMIACEAQVLLIHRSKSETTYSK
jgi:hypothetical protein